MRSDTKLVAWGMVIGVALGAGLLLFAFFMLPMLPGVKAVDVTPSPTNRVQILASPTMALPSATATFTPIAAASLSTNVASGFDLASSPTPDPVAASIAAGDLVFSGPLSGAQQAAVFRASIKYVQSSVAASKRAAKEINGVGYGDPTNICGPLAIAILRDAGVISAEIVPHDYWLLNPVLAPDQRLINAAFPPERFTHEVDPTPLNKMDWSVAPLHPGDFLFIWHGSWGNFDHMLVVNRVDSQGRAFAVTNYGTPAGYLIAETMLYDPNEPNAGVFHTWTQARDQVLGSTGFGGYEVWRVRAGQAP